MSLTVIASRSWTNSVGPTLSQQQTLTYDNELVISKTDIAGGATYTPVFVMDFSKLKGLYIDCTQDGTTFDFDGSMNPTLTLSNGTNFLYTFGSNPNPLVANTTNCLITNGSADDDCAINIRALYTD